MMYFLKKAIQDLRFFWFLLIIFFAFGTTQFTFFNIPIIYSLPLVLSLLIFFTAYPRLEKNSLYVMGVFLISSVSPLYFNYPFSPYFLASFSIFLASLFFFVFISSFLFFNVVKFKKNENLILYIISIFLCLSILEITFLLEFFDQLRVWFYGLGDSDIYLVTVDQKLRRASEMLFVRPSLFFTEASNFGKVMAVLIALYFVISKKFIRSIYLLLFSFLLIRSPSVLLTLPVFFYHLKLVKHQLRNKFLLSLLLSILFVIIITFLYFRVDFLLSNVSYSLLERLILPLTFFMENRDVFIWGLAPGNLVELNTFICNFLRVEDDVCDANPPAAFNAIFGYLNAYGVIGLSIMFFLSFKMRFDMALTFIFSLFFIGIFVAGYNMPKFFLLLAVNFALILFLSSGPKKYES